MVRQAGKRTDFGTVVLHWLLVLALLIAALSGLRITSNNPDYAFLQALDPILPAGSIWSWHILAGVIVFSTACAYTAYIFTAGLGRRIRLDEARVMGLTGRPQARLASVNILSYWALFASLIVLFGTGIYMYLGHGGWVVWLHRTATWCVLAFPVLHIAVHFAIGGKSQLLSIVRPAHLLPPPPRFDPFAIIALPDYSARAPIVQGQAKAQAKPAKRPEPDMRPMPKKADAVEPWWRSGPMLQTNPLVVAIVAGFSAAGLLMSLDAGSRDVLEVRRVTQDWTPDLDGDMADPVWRTAKPVYVETHQGANFDGEGASTVEVRAVHDGSTAYFLFIWNDPTRSLKILPLIKKEDGWHVVQTNFGLEDENIYFDDSFSVALTTTDQPNINFPGGHSFHIGPKPLDDKPASFSGRGLHYTNASPINDIWHWKASRGGLLGWCDDGFIGPPSDPTAEEAAGLRRYYGGLGMDPGEGMSAYNFAQRPNGGYELPVRPKRLPKNPQKLNTEMGTFSLDHAVSEVDGSTWWLTEEESVPYSAEADARMPVGSVIPGILIAGAPTDDRGDARCAGRWSGGRWSLEIARPLDTGSENDIVIGNDTAFRIAVFDHSQIGHTRQIRAIRMKVE